MGGAEHTEWNHAVPVRYLLIKEDAEDVEHLWGRCAAVEGLFVDPPPPPREVLVLRRCRPDGVLAEALARPDVSHERLGDAAVTVWDDERPVQWWGLVDVVVLAHQPNLADPALYDIVLGAGVDPDDELTAAPQPAHFELTFEGDLAGASHCMVVDGLFKPRTKPPPVPMELIGCAPTEPLLAALRRPDRGWGRLLVLDREGNVMASLPVDLEITGVRPSALGGDLIDVTLTDGGDYRRPPAARPVWDQWYPGPPTEPNLWAPYDSRGRVEWLELTTRAWRVPPRRPDLSGGEYHLDGRFVTDLPGFHCAIAEALLGPGRYFGREFDAFKDCLSGGFGVIPPFTLVWHDSGVAQRTLGGIVTDPEGRLSYFDEMLELLQRYGVTVVLQDSVVR